VRRPLTAEEQERVRARRQEIEAELPELRWRARQLEAEMRRAAMEEPTISGQLRKAIAESGMDFREIADQVGVSRKLVAEFLVGRHALDSAAIDRIGTLLRQELKPAAS
jgi:chromosome condensin MukBEF ATPase and DNA-binding subunit MukB